MRLQFSRKFDPILVILVVPLIGMSIRYILVNYSPIILFFSNNAVSLVWGGGVRDTKMKGMSLVWLIKSR